MMMDVKIALPVLISFAISAAAGPIVIPILRKLKAVSYTHLDVYKRQVQTHGI